MELAELMVRIGADLAQVEAMPQQVARAFRQVEATANRYSAGVERGFDRIRLSTNVLADQLDEVEQRFRGLRAAADGLESVGTRLTVGVTLPLLGIGGLAVDAAVDMDSLRRALENAAGSAAEAERQFAQLEQVARLPGLGLEEAIQGSVSLQAVNVNADLAARSLAAFGNALASVGRGRVELEGVNLALTQIVSKSGGVTSALRLSQEELLQLQERVPQISAALRGAFDSSIAEDINRLGLTAGQFVEQLVSELEKLPRVSAGVKNDLENLGDSARQAGDAFGSVLLPAVSAGAAELAEWADEVRKASPDTLRWVAAIGTVGVVAGPATLGLSNLTTAMSTLAIAARVRLLPMLAVGGPVVIGLGAVAAALVKNKLDALAAADAARGYSDALRDLAGASDAASLALEAGAVLAAQERVAGRMAELQGQGATLDNSAELRRLTFDYNALEIQLQATVDRFNELQKSADAAAEMRAAAAARTQALREQEQAATRLARQLERVDDLLRGQTRIGLTGGPSVGGIALDPVALERYREMLRQRLELSGALDLEIKEVRTVSLDTDAAAVGGLEGLLERIGDFGDRARVIEGSAQGLLAVGDALGALSEESRRALSGVLAFAQGVQTLQAAQGMSGVASVAGTIGGAAGIVGGVISAVSGLAGLLSRQEQQSAELVAALRGNADAMRDLRNSLTGFRPTFGAEADVAAALRAAIAGVDGQVGYLQNVRPEFLTQFLTPLGLSLDELTAVAEKFNITLFEGGRVIPQAVLDLQEAIRATALSVQEFGKTLEGQRTLMDARLEVFDITEPARILEEQIGLLARQAPNLFGDLENLNFDSGAAQAVLEQRLRELLEGLLSGTLTAADLEGFTSIEEFLRVLTSTDQALDRLADSADRAAGALSGVPELFDLALRRRMAAYSGGSGATGGVPTDTGGSIPTGGGITVNIYNPAPGVNGEQIAREVKRTLRDDPEAQVYVQQATRVR